MVDYFGSLQYTDKMTAPPPCLTCPLQAPSPLQGLPVLAQVNALHLLELPS